MFGKVAGCFSRTLRLSVASVHVRSPCSPRLAEVGTPNGIDVMGGDIPKSGQDLAGAGGTSMVRVVPQC